MSSLIYNSKVIATGKIKETPESFSTSDAIFPKVVIQGAFLIKEEPTEVTPNTHYVDGSFVEILPPSPEVPKEPVPKEVTMRQARLLLSRKNLLKKVTAALPNEEAKIEFEYATTVSRTSPLLSILNMSEEELDNLFIEASKI